MSIQSIGFTSPRPKDSTGNPVNRNVNVPIMRPRTGPRGTDDALLALLESAQEQLADTDCSFWACDGPTRPKYMCTCRKCWAMREVGTVIASLKHRLST